MTLGLSRDPAVDAVPARMKYPPPHDLMDAASLDLIRQNALAARFSGPSGSLEAAVVAGGHAGAAARGAAGAVAGYVGDAAQQRQSYSG
jgi:hypothetical protein